MVYNTTDNRSSLSITDLTSDGEYSVTVAGRDGAGRLGQESEELNIALERTSGIKLLFITIFKVFLPNMQRHPKLMTMLQIWSHYIMNLGCQPFAIQLQY